MASIYKRACTSDAHPDMLGKELRAQGVRQQAGLTNDVCRVGLLQQMDNPGRQSRLHILAVSIVSWQIRLVSRRALFQAPHFLSLICVGHTVYLHTARAAASRSSHEDIFFLCLLVMAASPGLVKGIAGGIGARSHHQAYLLPAWGDHQPLQQSLTSICKCLPWQLLTEQATAGSGDHSPPFGILGILTPASCFCLLSARMLRQQGGVCGAFASASATAVSTGGSATAQSQAVAQSICNGLRSNDGTSIAQAISTASSSGNAETVAQAIAEAASGGETQIAAAGFR
jgi:hypothetical protein